MRWIRSIAIRPMVSLEDYAWLSTQRGQEAWSELRHAAGETRRASIRAIPGVEAARADLLFEQLLMAQGKSRAKVECPHRWFWTQRLLEQASDEWTAHETALDAPLAASQWLDVCCGAGVDAVALAKRRPNVMGIDCNPVAIMLTRANALMNQVDVQAQSCQAESLQLDRDIYLNIDPDRRVDGERTIDPTRSQPPWSWISQAVGRCGAVSLKLAPALRVDQGFDWGIATKPQAMRWLSWDGSVRQQRWYWGIDRWPDEAKIASCGSKRYGWHHEVFAMTPPSSATKSSAMVIQDVSRLMSGFIADQDPVVRAAGVADRLAERLRAVCVGDRNGYFLSPNPIQHPMLHWFRILEVLAMDTKKIRAMARGAKACHWELKSRGVDIDLVAIQRQLHLDPASDQRRTLLFTRLGKKRVAIVAQRLEREFE